MYVCVYMYIYISIYIHINKCVGCEGCEGCAGCRAVVQGSRFTVEGGECGVHAQQPGSPGDAWAAAPWTALGGACI